MAQYIGMDPDEVDDLAAQLQAKASDLETVLSTLTSKLGSTTWVGTDRNRFEEAWQGTISVNLTNAANQLRDAATAATGDANQQRAASS